MILNITLTVRITLYNKATFVALIVLLQLYFIPFKLNQNVTYIPGRFLLHFETFCLQYVFELKR